MLLVTTIARPCPPILIFTELWKCSTIIPAFSLTAYVSQYAPTIAAGAYTVAFGDFQNYWIADRTGRTVRRADELHIANLQTGFYAFQRVDAKTVLPEGIKLLKQHA